MSKALDLVKGLAIVSDEHVLSKGAKPPAGYTPIPGGKKGGYRKRKGAGWTYWYADKQGGGSSGRAAKKPDTDWFMEIVNAKVPEPTDAEKDAARAESIHRATAVTPFRLGGYRGDSAAYRRWNFKDGGEGEAGSVTYQLPYRSGEKEKLKGSDPVTVYMDTKIEGGSRHYTGGGIITKDGKKVELRAATGHERRTFEHMGEALQHQLKVKYQGYTGPENRYLRGTKKSEDPSKPITGYRMGSVTYVESPAYELPDGGQVRRPGLDPAMRAQPPVIDDGRDPYVSELARLSGRMVNPGHGILAHVHGHGTDNSEG